MLEATEGGRESARLRDVFGPEFLIRRPLLEALDPANERPPVLLIDELDRSDAEFEAYLLELLSDYQITIPEIGTQRAARPPVVIITSNRTRDIHDALRRRCLYYWIEYPTLEKEYTIVRTRVPEASEMLARQVVAFVQLLRVEDLFKAPGVAETLDWLGALTTLGATELTEGSATDALGALLKYQDDTQKVTANGHLGRLVEKARDAAARG
jgi:MoxR-like ATPase